MAESFESIVKKNRKISGIIFECIILDSWNEDDRIVTGKIYIDVGSDNVSEQRVIVYEKNDSLVLKKIS